MITERPHDATNPPATVSAVAWLAQGLESLFENRPYRGPQLED